MQLCDSISNQKKKPDMRAEEMDWFGPVDHLHKVEHHIAIQRNERALCVLMLKDVWITLNEKKKGTGIVQCI